MKYFFVYYKNGSVGRCMKKDLKSAYKFYSDLGIISQISFIEEV